MTHTNTTDLIRPALQVDQHVPTIAIFLIWAANVVTIWSHRSGSRKALAQLENHRLEDLGISQAEAERESLKCFWMA